FLEEAQKLNTTISGYTFDVNDFINDELYASTSFQHMTHEWQHRLHMACGQVTKLIRVVCY
ncbi:hypothetical protein, partial [Staphylococcus chromogenes]|uniref:hypothetical protein n=1 Tax=Staphylococcus chromogenes TaxID=46126 RepID=UPI000EDD8CAA